MIKKYKNLGKGVFYLNNKNCFAGLEDINFLYDQSVKMGINMTRLCLHNNENSQLMTMLIVLRDRFTYPIHRHSWKDESYTIVLGSIRYEEYDEKKTLLNKYLLREGDSIINKSKLFHCMIPLDDKVAFIENTVGPFQNRKLEYI